MADVLLVDSDVLAKFGRSNNLDLLLKAPGQILITREIYSEIVDGANLRAPGATAALDWLNKNEQNPKIAVARTYLSKEERNAVFNTTGDAGELSIDKVLNEAFALSDPNTFAVLSDSPQARVVAGFLANTGGVFFGHEYLGSLLAQGYIKPADYFDAVGRSNYTGGTAFYGPPEVLPDVPYSLFAAKDKDVFGKLKDGAQPIGTVIYDSAGGILFKLDGQGVQYFAPGSQVGFQGDRDFGQLVDMSTGLPIPVTENDNCFLAGTMISMWPLDASIKPNAGGIYDRYEVLAKVWSKPIETITPDDWVLSYDRKNNLLPGKVTRVFQSQAKHILDVFGMMVTPGHAALCGDGRFAGKHVPIIDILRSDGALVCEDGTMIRANTGCKVGSYEDRFVLLAEGHVDDKGNLDLWDQGLVRVGARFITGEGKDISIADILGNAGATVNAEGRIEYPHMDFAMPLHLSFLVQMPQPEDYILRRSNLTLREIYEANEWEDAARPQMQAPVILDRGPVRPLPEYQSNMMPRNEPMSFTSAFEHLAPSMNRKARKAMEARQRMATKAMRRILH